MLGFITIISNQKLKNPIPISWKEKFYFQSDHVNRRMSDVTFQLEQQTSSKFLSEKLWINNADYVFVIEGVILNLQQLAVQHGFTDPEQLLYHLYLKDNEFFKSFEGNFAGVFFDKRAKKWLIFNNQTATQKLYYYETKNYLVVSTDLFTLCKAAKSLGLSVTVDETAAYLLLSNGYMLDNLTLINNVKQVRAGEFLEYKNQTLVSRFYFHLQNFFPNNDNIKTIIETLDEKFRKAVKLEFDLDMKYNYRSISTMSGGLDSRMSALIGYKEGFYNQTFFNFSEKGYADEVIANLVAKEYNFEIESIHLDAHSLIDFDQNISVNDGQNTFTNCSHVFYAIRHLNVSKNMGSLHTGMIGDAVMGSFLSNNQGGKVKPSHGVYVNNINFPISRDYVNELIKKYPNEEIYKFYGRAFVGANNGFLFFNLLGESFSPFLNTDFLSYAFSIPTQYKFKERIYIDWIKEKHPDIASFIWENIGGKPTNNELLRKAYRVKRALIKRLPLKSMWKHNMSPEQVWYNNNKLIQKKFGQYFYENLPLLEFNPKLMQDTRILFENSTKVNAKAECITLVGAVKLLLD